MAHANRGRPNHRRLPDAARQRIVQLARSTYAGSTNTISARGWSSARAFPSAGKRYVACCATTASARRESAAHPLIASVACVPRGSAN